MLLIFFYIIDFRANLKRYFLQYTHTIKHPVQFKIYVHNHEICLFHFYRLTQRDYRYKWKLITKNLSEVGDKAGNRHALKFVDL